MSEDSVVSHESLASLVETMVKALVDEPEQVKVSLREGERTTVVELRVAQVDFGKVIGKQGRTADALRTVLKSAGAKIGRRCVLEVIE